MIDPPLPRRALELARAAHQGQVDKAGVPYLHHPCRLAEGMPDEITTCVALLHDVLEDTPVTLAQLERDFPPEVTQAVDTLLSHGVDCLSNLTDNNVVGVLGAILEKTDEAGIPVYGSEVEQVKLGCVGGAGLDYIQLGIQTGLMAAKVLTGEAACEDLPYETIENYGLYINSDAAAELGITIPDDIAQEAQECAE